MSTIKVIAPLSPAGEFPIADANNISLGSGGDTPKPGSVAEAVSELQQELGITAGVEESVSAKLDYVKDNLDSKTSTTEITTKINEALTELKSLLGNTTNNPSLFTELTTLAADLLTLREYIGRDSSEGLTKVLDTIYTRTGTLVNCIGDTDEGILGSINAMTSEINGLLAQFDSFTSTTSGSLDSLTSDIKDVLVQFESLESKTNDNFTTFTNDTNEKFNTFTSSTKEQFDTFTSSTKESLDSLTTVVSGIVEDTETTLLTNINSKLGVAEDENVKGLINKLATSVGTNVSNAVKAINVNLGTYAEGENVKTTVENESNSIKEALSALRSHMNTMVPPTLRVSRNGDAVYKKDITPEINVTASVNRPLEEPLAIYIDGVKTTVTDRSCSAIWKPTYSGDSLPEVSTVAITIAHKDDPTLIYATQTLSCTFAENVYWGVSDADSIETINDLLEIDNELSAGHPTTVTFKITDSTKYCYYLCPKSYTPPTISVGGFAGGFTKCTETMTLNDISYNIYRSNQKLNSTTITIK